MTKNEMVNVLKVNGVTCNMRMTKAQLEDLYSEMQSLNTEHESEGQTVEPILNAEQNKIMFDTKKYAGFVLNSSLRDQCPTPKQMDLVDALERNFKVKFNPAYATAGDVSDAISRCYAGIADGTVKPRPVAEVKASLEGYVKSVQVKMATKAQLAMLDKLEKETGVVNTAVVSSSSVASELIKKYMALRNAQRVDEAAREAAIATTNNSVVKNVLTRHSVFSTLKRVLGF